MTLDATPRTVVVERVLPHPPQKVWRALTEGAILEDWLMANDFQPVVGHRFQFRAAPQPHWDGIVHGEVLVVEPPERLVYRWESAGLRTEVTWTLAAAEGGARLRMEQSGFGPDDMRNEQGAIYGWQRYFDGLERALGGLS